MVDVRYFDAENGTKNDVPVYVIGSNDKDTYLYSGAASIANPTNIKWTRGTTAIPNVGNNGYFSVRNGVAYYFQDHILNISSDLGNTWVSYPVKVEGNFDSMCVATDKVIVLGSSDENGGIAFSLDGGKTWNNSEIDPVKSDGNGESINKIYTIAALPVNNTTLLVAGIGTKSTKDWRNFLLLSKDNGYHWQRIGGLETDDEGRMLDSKVGKILSYNGYFFLIQETGISLGQIYEPPPSKQASTGSDIFTIGWEPAFPGTEIADWPYTYRVELAKEAVDGAFVPDTGGGFAGKTLELPLMKITTGQCFNYAFQVGNYNLDKNAGPVSIGINPFAKPKFSQIAPRLRIVTAGESGATACMFFLNPEMVFSGVSDTTTSWGSITVTDPA